jgi:hypothetical protein
VSPMPGLRWQSLTDDELEPSARPVEHQGDTAPRSPGKLMQASRQDPPTDL